MRFLVAGASGLLGTYLVRSFAQAGDEVVGTFHSPPPGPIAPGWVTLDVTDERAVDRAVRKARADLVINATGFTDVDGCEREPLVSRRVNVDGTEFLARAAASAGARFLHVSTDAVFDGARGNYRETDEANPISEYARQKWEAERRVRAVDSKSLILRVAVLYGHHPTKVDFVKWLRDGWAAGLPRPVVADQIVTPTFAGFTAEAARSLVALDASGTFHVCGKGALTRFDFARLAASALGYDPRVVQESRMAAMPWIAKRPPNASLDVSRLEVTLAAPVPGHAQSLARYVAEVRAATHRAVG